MQIGKLACAGQHILAPCDIRLARPSRRSDLALDHALPERRKDAAGFFDLLEQRPSGVAQLPRQALDAAGAGRGIGHLGEVGFLQKNKLRVARRAPREGIRQSQRQRMRQHGDGIGAAKSGGECRHGRAQHVHVGVSLGQHAPGRFGCDENGLRRHPTGCLDPRPQQAKRAEFRDRQELIGICAEPECQRVTRAFEHDAAGFHGPQIGEGDRQCESQFLRLRSTGIVHRTAIGKREWALEAATDEVDDHFGERLLNLVPRRGAAASDRHGGERLIVEAEIDLRRIDVTGIDQPGEVGTDILASEHGIERNRNPGIEDYTGKQALQRLRDSHWAHQNRARQGRPEIRSRARSLRFRAPAERSHWPWRHPDGRSAA